MKAGILYILWLGVTIAFLPGCSRPEELPDQGLADVAMMLDADLQTKASSDVGTPTYSVDRVLVVPFQKMDLALPDSRNDNFVPVWSLARQFDIPKFPAKSLTFGLDASKIYKVLVIGYNHADYNHTTPSANSNRFYVNIQPSPSSLANFQLYAKMPNEIPEIFICYGVASNGNTTIGTVFAPGAGVVLNGRLGRIVSALGVKVRNIPSYVKSVSLVAENLVKAIRVADTTASVVQTAGDGESRLIRTQNVSGGSVDFGEYLLPTKNTYKTRFYLDVALGTLTQRYVINVEDSKVSSNDRIILYPNRAVKITGSYNDINYGFVITRDINLDDNSWDGVVPSPAP